MNADAEALVELANMVIEQRKNARKDKTLNERHFRFALDCAADQAERALTEWQAVDQEVKDE